MACDLCNQNYFQLASESKIRFEERMKDFIQVDYFTACTNLELIKAEPFLKLNPGDKINSIGRLNKNGKITSSSRVDEFSKLLTYRGIVQYDGNEWLCFEVPRDGLSGFNMFNQETTVCIMYMILKSEGDIELIVPYWSRNGGSIKIFKPEFSINESIIL